MAVRAPEIKAHQYYRTVSAAVRDGWPETLDGGKLTVDQYNHLGDIARALLDAGPLRTGDDVSRTALATFKFQYVRDGAGWRILPWLELRGVRVLNRRAPQPVIEASTPLPSWRDAMARDFVEA